MNETDPRVIRTRRLLLDAFAGLLKEKGFRAMSVQDIASRATVNRATFYAHFEDKYALMESFIRTGFQQRVAEELSRSAAFTMDNLRLLIGIVLEYLVQVESNQCRGAKQHAEPLFETIIQDELYQILLSWLKQPPPADVRCWAARETAAVAMSWAIFGAGLQWSQSRRNTPAEEMADQMVGLLTHGLFQAMEIEPTQAH
ncbi:MAG: TetR/AcrR family transcriptional regulator [Anaerolineae bacterium]|nr:TetR/AcrR family transcriptional regulator [Anaerolineae bacterium]MCB0180138.1 TetR/AcrR family transcriptional regulator [Anaerolineae bacterium]MCB9109414.1 TetR/AcrR family transcriptional regulator [Anaerolineales bacterium]